VSDEQSPFSSDPEYLQNLARDAAERAVTMAQQAQAEQAAERAAKALAANYTIEYDGNMPLDPWDNVSYDRFHIDDGKGGETFLRKAAIAFTETRTHFRKNGAYGVVWHKGTWCTRVEGVRADEYVQHLVYKHVTDIPQRAGAVLKAVLNRAPLGDPPTGTEYVGFRNGDLRLSDLELVPADPSHGIWTRVQTEWDADATCPKFSAYIDRHVVAEDHGLLWAMIADSMVPRLCADALYLLLGKGRTGKGTILAGVQRLAGPYAGTITLSAFGQDKFAASFFDGCTVAIDEDTEARYLEGCAALKRLTSANGQQSIEAKGKDAINKPRTASIVAASNDKPVFDDPALARRLRLIRTRSENSFVNREDPSAVSKLFTPQEMRGIAHQAVIRGLLPLLDGTSPAFQSNEALIQEIRVQGSATAAWLQEQLENHYKGRRPPEGSDLRVTYAEFKTWCALSGEKEIPHRRWQQEMDRHLQDFGWKTREKADKQWRQDGRKVFESGWVLRA
jgi:phage/plasmid-associated DNA primase